MLAAHVCLPAVALLLLPYDLLSTASLIETLADVLSALLQVWYLSTCVTFILSPTVWNRPHPFGLTQFPCRIYSFSLALGLYTPPAGWTPVLPWSCSSASSSGDPPLLASYHKPPRCHLGQYPDPVHPAPWTPRSVLQPSLC